MYAELTIVDTPNGFEVRADGRRIFGPTSEVEAESFVQDALWHRRY